MREPLRRGCGCCAGCMQAPAAGSNPAKGTDVPSGAAAPPACDIQLWRHTQRCCRGAGNNWTARQTAPYIEGAPYSPEASSSSFLRPSLSPYSRAPPAQRPAQPAHTVRSEHTQPAHTVKSERWLKQGEASDKSRRPTDQRGGAHTAASAASTQTCLPVARRKTAAERVGRAAAQRQPRKPPSQQPSTPYAHPWQRQAAHLSPAAPPPATATQPGPAVLR